MSNKEIVLNYDEFGKLKPSEIQSLLEQACIEGLEVIADVGVELIKQRVNVDTGTMRGSVRHETVGNVVSIIMGGEQYINPKTGKPCNYAPAQEKINPTFEPVLEMLGTDIERTLQMKIEQKLTEAGVMLV